MTKEKDIVPKHTSFQIDCQVQAQQLKKDITLVFELDMNPHRAEGLEFCETLVKLRSGALPYIVLDVQNPIDHHIELLGRTVVGTSQQVQVVLLLSSRNPVISLSDSESSQCRECASCWHSMESTNWPEQSEWTWKSSRTGHVSQGKLLVSKSWSWRIWILWRTLICWHRSRYIKNCKTICTNSLQYGWRNPTHFMPHWLPV